MHVLAMLLVGIATTAVGQANAATPEPIVVTQSGRSTLTAALDRVASADVVFIGENHDHRAGHAFELAALQFAAAHRSKTVLALEMFERDTQLVLDEYLYGHISEASFLAASRPWPNYRADYRPLVEYCRDQHLAVVGSNAPRRYVNAVSRNGSDALLKLPPESRRYLPRLPIDPALSADYASELDKLFGGAHSGASGAASGTMPSVENMKAAQMLWDATMADTVLRTARRNRGALIVHVNGSMHSDHGYGIVERVRRAAPRLKVVVVTVKPDPAYPAIDDAAYARMADIAVVYPPDAPAPNGSAAAAK